MESFFNFLKKNSDLIPSSVKLLCKHDNKSNTYSIKCTETDFFIRFKDENNTVTVIDNPNYYFSHDLRNTKVGYRFFFSIIMQTIIHYELSLRYVEQLKNPTIPDINLNQPNSSKL